MKKFSDYIKEQHKYPEIFEEYKFLSKLDFWHFRRIFENSASLYDGQFELADFLAREIGKNITKNKSISFDKTALEKKFKNIFFDNIEVNYKPQEDNNLGGYKFKDNRIIININSDEVTKYQTICGTISHELKHAWQDFKTDFSDNSPSVISNSPQYKEIVKELNNKNFTISGAANYLYHIYKIETDAFSSEFSAELKIDIKNNKPKDINDCINYAEEINIFSDLIIYKTLIRELNKNNEIFGINKESLIKEINNLSKKNYSWESFNRKIFRKIEKLFNKLCHNIATLFYEYEENIK